MNRNGRSRIGTQRLATVDHSAKALSRNIFSLTEFTWLTYFNYFWNWRPEIEVWVFYLHVITTRNLAVPSCTHHIENIAEQFRILTTRFTVCICYKSYFKQAFCTFLSQITGMLLNNYFPCIFAVICFQIAEIFWKKDLCYMNRTFHATRWGEYSANKLKAAFSVNFGTLFM